MWNRATSDSPAPDLSRWKPFVHLLLILLVGLYAGLQVERSKVRALGRVLCVNIEQNADSLDERFLDVQSHCDELVYPPDDASDDGP